MSYRLDDDDRQNLAHYATFRDLRPHMHLSAVLTQLSTTPNIESQLEPEQHTAALDNFMKAVSALLYAPGI